VPSCGGTRSIKLAEQARFSMVVECLASHDFPCAPGVVGYARDELGWGDGERRTARQGGVRYR
jgi:hypothetical protein